MSKYIGPLIGSVIFMLYGFIQLKYPEFIRRYDTRMTRLIKDEKTYADVSTAFGILFLTMGFSAFSGILLYFISLVVQQAF